MTFKEKLSFNEPIPDFETRYPGKLEGILNSVRQTYGGNYLNATILDAAVAYFVQLVRGHPFANGNKRIGVLFTHAFLYYNNLDSGMSYLELLDLAIWVASSTTDLEYQKKVVKRAFGSRTKVRFSKS